MRTYTVNEAMVVADDFGDVIFSNMATFSTANNHKFPVTMHIVAAILLNSTMVACLMALVLPISHTLVNINLYG